MFVICVLRVGASEFDSWKPQHHIPTRFIFGIKDCVIFIRRLCQCVFGNDRTAGDG